MSRSLKPQTGFSSYSLNDPSPGRKAAIVQVAVGRGWSFLVGVPPPSQLSGGGPGSNGESQLSLFESVQMSFLSLHACL